MSLPVLGSMVLAPRINLLARSLSPVALVKASSKLRLSNIFPAFSSLTLNEPPSDLTASDTQSPL